MAGSIKRDAKHGGLRRLSAGTIQRVNYAFIGRASPSLPRRRGRARYRRSSSRRTGLLYSRSSVSRPRHHFPQLHVVRLVFSAVTLRDHLCAAVAPTAECRGLRLILPLDEHLPHLDQLQLRLLARSRMPAAMSRLTRCGPRSWTCGHTTRPNPFSSRLSFCAPRARDANPVLLSIREACKRLRSRYRRLSSRPPLDAPPTETTTAGRHLGC
jgi:hypothetical protein